MRRLPPHPIGSLAALAALAALALCPDAARATYSIAAADSDTDQVGGASTSCLGGGFSVAIVYDAAPGAGVVHAQARIDPALRGRERAVELLEAGTAPEDIIAEITDTSFDSDAEHRQYGIVDVTGRAAGFTGSEAIAYAEDRQGEVGSYAYSVQGNILTSGAVIDQAEDAFRGGGCDLADRLIRALEAGAEGGEGDSRCTGDGIPSDSALLQVDRPGEPVGSFLRIEVDSEAGRNPLPVVRARYDDWRAEHPCPGAGADAGPPSDGGAGDDAGAPDTDGGDAEADGGEPDAGEDADGAGDDGCGCGAVTSGADPWPTGLVLALALLGWLARRRR